MVKEYLREKIDMLNENRESLIREKERLLVVKECFHDNIVEIQENSDIDFEIFSPRTKGSSPKGRLNELYSQINEIKKQIVKKSREIEMVDLEINNFKTMLAEVEELEQKSKRQ